MGSSMTMKMLLGTTILRQAILGQAWGILEEAMLRHSSTMTRIGPSVIKTVDGADIAVMMSISELS